MKIAIVIPARYGSTRLPGKPMAQIAGVAMLERVIHQAKQALSGFGDSQLYVATEDQRIFDYAQSLEVQTVMTSDNCASGSDRVYEAIQSLPEQPEIIINLQGDVPLVEPQHIQALIQQLVDHPEQQVATPIVQLTWQALAALEEQKRSTPFSGTTAVVDQSGQALWFSKNIIPAMRKRESLQSDNDLSPVYKHIGLYAYRIEALQQFIGLPVGDYEALEGLEQLRFLENGIAIQCVPVQSQNFPLGIGVDTQEDIKRVEALIAQYGDPMHEVAA